MQIYLGERGARTWRNDLKYPLLPSLPCLPDPPPCYANENNQRSHIHISLSLLNIDTLPPSYLLFAFFFFFASLRFACHIQRKMPRAALRRTQSLCLSLTAPFALAQARARPLPLQCARLLSQSLLHRAFRCLGQPLQRCVSCCQAHLA